MIDLPFKYQKMVIEILKKHAPYANAWYYGSRVRGKARKYSDIDLMLEKRDKQKISYGEISEVREAFDESDLPYCVDITDWQKTDDSFKKLIKKYLIPVFGKAGA